MKYLLLLLSILLILREAVGPPVTTKKAEEGNEENELPAEDDWGQDIKYEKYLKEVVQALESDPQFKEKLEKAETVDIRTGKIAKELEFVNHNVRTKLDELKRQELERLRHLAVMQYNQQQLQRQELGEAEATGGGHRIGERQKLHIAPHLNHKNPHTFEVEDLRKLIVQTTKELEEADRRRREEFKQYELQKEFEIQERLRNSRNDYEREMLEKEYKELEEKHKKHPQLHHPGSKQQLEEVWQEQDHMNPEDFNPKTFFHLHDLDGNGVWDADEVKMLFQKELDKMYDHAAFEDDPRERQEEMERMREHVFNESDTNKDHLISYDEFLAQTKKTEYQQDPGWEGLDHTPAYTHEEYEAFERQRQEEVRKLVEQGLIPPQPVYGMDSGQMHIGKEPYLHDNRIPQHHPMASNQVHHIPQQHANLPPPAYHPGQVPYHPVATNHVPQQHPPQAYAGSAGHHGAYGNIPHPPQHPPVAQEGYAKHEQGAPLGYNQQHQQAPPMVSQGQMNPGGPPHGAGGHESQGAHHPPQQLAHSPQQPAHSPQQPAHSPQQPAHSPQQLAHSPQQPAHSPQQPAHHPQPVGNQHMEGSQQASQHHQQGHTGTINSHNENSQQFHPNAGSDAHGLEGNANPSSANQHNQHSNEGLHSVGGREHDIQQNKVPSPQ
ncbi:nucleobindin-2 [Hetaerina americana]|uniref:nucleobindin-2 n=1 Tax=Hetaerina americana TaxID=62018 RepID=UPI003A7F3761